MLKKNKSNFSTINDFTFAVCHSSMAFFWQIKRRRSIVDNLNVLNFAIENHIKWLKFFTKIVKSTFWGRFGKVFEKFGIDWQGINSRLSLSVCRIFQIFCFFDIWICIFLPGKHFSVTDSTNHVYYYYFLLFKKNEEQKNVCWTVEE